MKIIIEVPHDEDDWQVENLTEAIEQSEATITSIRMVSDVTAERLWRVDDNVTGQPVSREFDTDDAATAICREFNSSPAAGGRYHVVTWIDDGLEWRRAR